MSLQTKTTDPSMASTARLRQAVLMIVLALASASSSAATNSLELTRVARERLNRSVVALEDKIRSCNAKAAVAIPASTFKELGLTQEQFAVVLKYFGSKTDTECLQPEAGAFVMASDFLQSVSPPSIERQVSELVWGRLRNELESQVAFEAFPVDLQAKIRAIPQLQAPFDMIATLEQWQAAQRGPSEK